MTSEQRRESILAAVRKSSKPLTGAYLARLYNVSRQIIVQDIAILRAAGYDIIATPQGYLIPRVGQSQRITRVIAVKHSRDQIEDELTTIVDLGGTVVDVFIWHKVYGKLSGRLDLDSRRKVGLFMDDIRSGRSTPLMKVTDDYHYHTVEADDEETLDIIGETLGAKGYLVDDD